MKRKKYTKLILTMVITIMLSCLLAVSVSAGDVFDSGTCGENVTWTLTNGGRLYISGTGEMEDYTSSIQVPWDKYRSFIKDVVIIEGVTRIDAMALSNCTNVTSITIPGSVTSISGLSSCSNLISVHVDENNASYSADANGVLFNKTQTELICYPAGKTDTAYTIPDTVTSIGQDAFYWCENLTSIEIPQSVISIGSSVFTGCSSLREICVDERNSNYSSDTNGVLFNKMQTKLICYPAGKTDTTYAIPSTVTTIDQGAFYGCSSLTNVTIPEGVTSIGYGAFYGCSSLASITIPESVTSIGSSAFLGCSGLASVTIPNGVTSVSLQAFYGCSSLASITIPQGVTSIERSAFSGCSSLTNVTIPEGVTSIGDVAFYGCSSLASITIPESVTSIGAQAFSFCRQLTKAEILTQTATFGSGVFNYTHADFTIHGYAGSLAQAYAIENSHPFALLNAIASGVCGENLMWTLSNDYVLFINGEGAMTDWEEETSIPWYNYRENITNVVVFDGVTGIGNGAFKACPNLIKAEIFSMDVTFGTDVFQGAHADFVLCGYLGSTADAYAKQNGLKFSYYMLGTRNVMQQAAWIDSVNLNLGSYGFGYGTPTTPYKMIDGLWAVGPNHKYEGLNTHLVDEAQYYNVDGVADENGEYLWFVTFELSSMYTVDNFMMYFIDLASLGVGVDNTLPWLPRSLDILVSETGENGSWKVVYRGSDLHTDTDPGAYAYHEATDSKLAYYDLSAVFSEAADAKYIRVASRSTSTDSVSIAAKWINISELEVFSKDAAVRSNNRPSVIPYPTSSPEPNDGNIMTSSSFVECVNVYGWPDSEPTHMIDGVWAVGPTHHEDGFNGRVNLDQRCDADNQLSETGEYLWTVTFELDKLRRVGSFRLINMDFTGSAGESAMVQWLQRSFDILVSATGEAGSWTVAYTGRNLHNEYSLGAYVYHEATDSKLAYYDLAADFGQWYNARYIKFASRDTTCDMLTTRNWINISELEVYETAIGVCGDNLDWELTEDGALTIGGNGSMANQIGSNFGEPFADYRSRIKTVSIGDGVTDIMAARFRNCTNLTAITIPQSVTSIGDSAFDGCDNLTIYGYAGSAAETYAAENGIPFIALRKVTASGQCGDDLTWTLYDDGELVISGTGEMYDWTSNSAPWYSYRLSVQSVVIEEGVTSIGRYAFFACINLTSVTLSEGITYIGTYAFTYCDKLTQLHIPASVTTIEDKAFLVCNSMESFTVGEGSKSFSAQDGVLFNANKTKLVRYPQAKAGTSYTIPNTVTTIGDDAFYIATALGTVHITANVSSIEPNAFNACSSLTVITVDANNPHFMADEGGVLFTKDKKTLYRYPQAKAGTAYTVPDGVTTIRFNAFARCTYLEELILPSSVYMLEEQSFAMAETMKKVTVLNPNATFGTSLFWRRASSAATICGYTGSTAETYAVENSMPFVAISDTISAPTITAPAGATVTAPEGGWKEGTNTFSVIAQFTCMVVVSRDGGNTYTRLEATPNADGSYSFSANISSDTIVHIAIAGDTNNNGELTTADINKLRAAFLGKITLDNYTALITDVNGDGEITTADVNRLRAAYLGKTTLPWN